jgi:hypothetical protein
MQCQFDLQSIDRMAIDRPLPATGGADANSGVFDDGVILLLLRGISGREICEDVDASTTVYHFFL